MEFQYALAGCPKIREQEPWGKAFSASFVGHGILALLLMIPMAKKVTVQNILTDVNFVEKPLPIQEGGPAASSGFEGDTRAGGKGESHPSLKDSRVSSNQGSPEGDAVTNATMSGPQMSIEDVGLVGKKKASLMPFVGHTPGGGGKGMISLPSQKAGSGSEIVLAKANLDEIRKTESSLGAPLISQNVISNPAEKRIKAAGPIQPKSERLKANPMEKERWGQKKGPFSLEGPLKYRKILKMSLPPYPRWAEEQGIEASISIRLWVDAKGRVKDNLYLEKASGYSEIDYLVKEVLSKFLFVRLPDDQPQEDEWGVATFRFELRN